MQSEVPPVPTLTLGVALSPVVNGSGLAQVESDLLFGRFRVRASAFTRYWLSSLQPHFSLVGPHTYSVLGGYEHPLSSSSGIAVYLGPNIDFTTQSVGLATVAGTNERPSESWGLAVAAKYTHKWDRCWASISPSWVFAPEALGEFPRLLRSGIPLAEFGVAVTDRVRLSLGLSWTFARVGFVI